MAKPIIIHAHTGTSPFCARKGIKFTIPSVSQFNECLTSNHDGSSHTGECKIEAGHGEHSDINDLIEVYEAKGVTCSANGHAASFGAVDGVHTDNFTLTYKYRGKPAVVSADVHGLDDSCANYDEDVKLVIKEKQSVIKPNGNIIGNTISLTELKDTTVTTRYLRELHLKCESKEGKEYLHRYYDVEDTDVDKDLDTIEEVRKGSKFQLTLSPRNIQFTVHAVALNDGNTVWREQGTITNGVTSFNGAENSQTNTSIGPLSISVPQGAINGGSANGRIGIGDKIKCTASVSGDDYIFVGWYKGNIEAPDANQLITDNAQLEYQIDAEDVGCHVTAIFQNPEALYVTYHADYEDDYSN